MNPTGSHKSNPGSGKYPSGSPRSNWRTGLQICVTGVLLALSGISSETVAQTAVEKTERPDITRTVAVTFDDLPVAYSRDLSERQPITADLLELIVRNNIPAVGFVNEGKLHVPGSDHRSESEAHPDEVELLKAWVDAGLELANHTFSHDRFDETPLDEFKEDVLRGEVVTRRIMFSFSLTMSEVGRSSLSR